MTPPPRSLDEVRARHAGTTILVCGCGLSLRTLPRDHGLVTVGVNDVGRWFDPTYLVVVNPPGQFRNERFRWVRESRAQALFTQLDLGPVAPPVVRFRLGSFGGTEPGENGTLPYTQNSPYVAVLLAALLGATRIGLVGVDFTDDHFFASTGRHPLAPQLPEIDAQYAALHAALARRGVELVNLSATSRLESLPKGSLHQWPASGGAARAVARSEAPLRIVSYATTPVAGVPPVLARCIAHATPNSARCVWATDRYGNGVAFDGDLQWSTHPAQAEAELAAAEVVVVHNGKADPRHARVLAGKPVVTLAHNYGWNVDMRFVQQGQPGLVVAQYQATLPEFAQWAPVPNPIPWWEPAWQPEPKPDQITICYTPSAMHERYPPGHRLYWHGKGAATTLAVLDRLAAELPIRLEVLRGQPVAHARALAMKRRAHIVIDECVTGSYHRNSLEGLAAGCVVVNGVGLLPGVAEVLARCAPDSGAPPFVRASLDTLEEVLRELIAQGAEALTHAGQQNRRWLERHWDFAAQWRQFWQPAMDAARKRRPPARIRPPQEPPMSTPTQDHKVSVIVPHGGGERLPLLAATLASLSQAPAVGEVIVVEMGAQPLAAELALRWGARHLFIAHDGPFERARALNAGTALAVHATVAWHDNDLLHAPAFLGRAAAELHSRGLDFLVPYTAVHYLGEANSLAVQRGERDLAEATVVNTLRSSGPAPVWIGCIGLVRRDFLQRHGGLIEGFRGWGGEDDAWFHKARLCGRIDGTALPDQYVWHLHHPLSGGLAPGEPGSANPHYAANVERLQAVRTVRDARELVQRFPIPEAATGRLSVAAAPASAPDPASAIEGLPVWTYWEGPCPAWIRACRRSMQRHLPGLRLLSPDSFARLRAGDADAGIDLGHLHVAHRADYIRAWLLARFGGLWIDADCVVMQPLDAVLGLLADHDFVGHRARGGVISNAFIAARPGSRIAAAYYARVRRAVAAKQRFSWNWLGGDLLTEVVAQDATGWHELPAQRIQPICWSRPQDFLAERDAAAHEALVDPQALTYMLSNVELGKRFPQAAGSGALLRERSFFMHLLRRALGGEDPLPSLAREAAAAEAAALFRSNRCESVSGTGSSLAQTAELRRRLPLLLEHLGVRRLLDAPCGDGNWMREVHLPGIETTGVEILAELVAEQRERPARSRLRFVAADLLQDPLPPADAVLCRDFLVHLAFADIAALLLRFAASGARYLITTHFAQSRPNRDIASGAWRPLNLELAPFEFPKPLHRLVEKCTEDGGAYADKSLAVWRLDELVRTPFLAGGCVARDQAA